MHLYNQQTIKLTPKAVFIILFAALFYFYEFIVQVMPAIIKEDLMREFAIDATKVGLISGSFYLSYAPMQLISGLLLDKYNARIMLSVVCFSFATGTLLFAFANTNDIYTASLARFIMGGAASCAFISVLHLIARWVPTVYFALFTGITEMMGSFGGLGGSNFLALLLRHLDWRTVTRYFAYTGFILAISYALIIRNEPAVPGLKTTKQIPNIENSIRQKLKAVINNKENWSIGLFSFFIWAPVLGFTALWGISFISLNNNLNTQATVHTISFVWLGITLASPFIGWLSDFIGRRCIIMTISSIIGIIAMIAVISISNLPSIVLNIMMLCIGFASASQALSFALIKDKNSWQINSTANGFNNMILVAGGLFFQPLIGKILDLLWQGRVQNGIHTYSLASYKIAFLIFPACYIIAALISIFFIKETFCTSSSKK